MWCKLGFLIFLSLNNYLIFAQNKYLPNHSYGKVDYLTFYINEHNDTLFKEYVTLDFTDQIWPADSQQNILLYYYDTTLVFPPRDSIILLYCPESYHIYWFSRDGESGYINNKDEFFMHPMRDAQYYLLQLAPFPYIIFNDTDSVWQFNVRPPDMYCQYSIPCYTSYRLIDKHYQYKNKECYYVKAETRQERGVSTMDLFYNKNQGPLYISYHLFNGVTINIYRVKE